jgi:DNA-binding transcriptional MerR regulator
VRVLVEEVAAYTVGEAARRAGVTRKAIRVYESRGLLPAPERTSGGYRLFTDGDVAVLQFIRRAKSLGLSLSEIAEVLDLQRGGAQPCGLVIGLLDGHLAQIERTLAELGALRESLLAARDTAEESMRAGQEAVFCRIIEGPWDRMGPGGRTPGAGQR